MDDGLGNEREKEVSTLKTDMLEIVLLNDSAEETRLGAHEGESPCPYDHCGVDYCTPSGFTDGCVLDFTG